MGLVANVYRQNDGTDCTNGGWSSQFDTVTVINVEGPFEPNDFRPAVLLMKHRTMQAIHMVSLADADARRWTMFGGNFLYCGDSRFGEGVARLLGREFQYAVGAVPIHDRVE